jgi:phenylalanyl-tRNA synthetase beta chain
MLLIKELTYAAPLPRQERNLSWELRHELRQALVGCGLQEVITYSLTTPEAEARLRASLENGREDPPYVRILNPSSLERAAMRRTLLAGLMEVAARNHRHRERLALFEIGLVYHPELGDGTLPREALHLGILLSGPVVEPSWLEPRPRSAGFFDLKGIVASMLELLHIEEFAFSPIAEAPFHPGIAAELRLGAERSGAFGQVHPAVRDAYELGERLVAAGEFSLEGWVRAARSRYLYRPFPRLPPVRQDLALVVEEALPAEKAMASVRSAAGPLLTDIRLFDVYRGPQVGAGKKSLAFQMTFVSDERSLTEEEVNAIREAMLPRLEAELGAKIR